MKHLWGLIFLLVTLCAHAQEQGIHFEHSAGWEEIKKMAREQNKYIFMDCYTTWCMPCKRISTELFPLKEMGDYFNSHFINVKVQMDKTDKDDVHVRSWYDAAAAIHQEYGIVAYPTFLYFSPKGELVHRVTDGGLDPQAFISTAALAFDAEKQSVRSFAEQFKKAKGNENLLRPLLEQTNKAYDGLNTQTVVEALLNLWNGNITRQASFADSMIVRSSDYSFSFLLNHLKAAEEHLGKGMVSKKLSTIILGEILYEKMSGSTNTNKVIDWAAIQQEMVHKYPGIKAALEVRLEAEQLQSQFRGRSWGDIEAPLMSFAKKHINDLTRQEKLGLARRVFNGSTEKKQLSEAISWLHPGLTSVKDDLEVRTLYANLLYKSGDRDKAVKLMEQVVQIQAGKQGGSYYSSLLNKMQSSEPTWNTVPR